MTSRLHRNPSPSLALLALLLLTLRATALDITKSADDFFHGGAMHYLSNNIPAALDVVTNALQQYPDDEKLKKLEALLKQQQPQQNQNQDQKQDQKNDQSQQSKQDDQQKADEQKKKEEQDKQKQAQQPKPDEQKNSGEQQTAAAQQSEQMTPEQAMRVLDTTKGDEKVLPVQMEKPPQSDKKLKDW